MEREIKTIYPTMKINAKAGEENDMPFSEVTAEIVSLRDVETRHGTKTIALLNEGTKKFQVFVNNVSMGTLIDTYGKDDTSWIGKKVKTAKSDRNSFGQEMIVLEPAQ